MVGNGPGQCQDNWGGIQQDWKTHKRGNMDQKESNMNQHKGSYQPSHISASLLTDILMKAADH